MKNKSFIVRKATIDDAQTIFNFINELALYEKAPEQVITTVDEIQTTLFGDKPQAHALIADSDNGPIGFAVYFYNYSTWLGKQGIYLEDLFVSPSYRGLGAGKGLLKEVAAIATNNNCGRVEWSVLDWNKPAIDFYQSFDAKPQDEWTVYRLTGEALTKFAKN